MLDVATHRQPILNSVANLFEALHANGIVYCNLKGNDQHLRNALTGESDIDVLFDANQKTLLESTLRTLGFKEFTAIREKRFKDIFDYFILDEPSGEVIHLHTYFGFTFGQPFLKGYQPDIARHILKTRVFNRDYGVYCIHAALELALLYLTETLKLRHRDTIETIFRKNASLEQKAIYQYTWLTARTTPAEVDEAFQAMFADHRPLSKLVHSEFNKRQLQQLALDVKHSLREYRLYGPFQGLLIRWWRELSVKMRRKLSAVLRLPILYTRSNPRGGKIVAVLEQDYHIQTILFQELKETFVKKIGYYQITFNKAQADDGDEPNQLKKHIRLTCRACSNWLRSKQIELAKKNGILVICDVIPESPLGFAAVPENRESVNPIIRLLIRLQSTIEAHAKRMRSPDLVFQFNTWITGNGLATHERVGLNNEGYSVVTMHPDSTLTEKLETLKSEIWNRL